MTERFPLLSRIDDPADLRRLSLPELKRLAAELRQFIPETVAHTGGHLGSMLMRIHAAQSQRDLGVETAEEGVGALLSRCHM